MNINELMIGDWVNVLGTPKQIDNFRKSKITGDETVYFDEDDLTFAKHVTPITITNDILEKSGFKKYIFNLDGAQYNCYEVGYNMYLVQNYNEGVAYTLGSGYYDSDNGHTLIGFAFVNYVHKLQHLMNDNICNKKDIVL